MEAITQTEPSMHHKQRSWISFILILLIALAAGIWKWNTSSSAKNAKSTSAVQIISALVTQADVSVKLTSNGTVSSLQSVDVHPQISAVVKIVHIKEGQFVHQGGRLFTLDTRTEDANLKKAEAQVIKDLADLANAERNLERTKELLKLEYVSQAEFDTAQNLVDGLRGQLAIDQASLEASRVTRSFNEITAPITGRTGAISVYPGSLVLPNGVALVSIAQVDPINVSFTLPERELANLQLALSKGIVSVNAYLDAADQAPMKGQLSFINNAVDAASGTIQLKAVFQNTGHRLWPGMFVNVTLSPRTLSHALTVPAQAVQIGPEKKFLYVIGDDHKVSSLPIDVLLIQEGLAVVQGVALNERVVVEGAQNLRPGSMVSELGKDEPQTQDDHSKGNNPNTTRPVHAGKQ